MGVYIWSRLPSEYQEVEYIQSSGTQYIDTGLLVKPNTEIQIDMQLTSVATNIRYFAVETNNNGGWVAFVLYLDSNKQIAFANGNWSVLRTGRNGDTSRYTFVANNSSLKIYSNGTNVYTGNAPGTRTTNSANNLYLLANDNNGTATLFASAKLYSCKMYEASTLVRDLIPCYRKSDTEIGLYDLVNNQFYTNSGSGTFTKGSDVDTYRESLLKNAYIGEYVEQTYTGSKGVYCNISKSGYKVSKIEMQVDISSSSSSDTYLSSSLRASSSSSIYLGPLYRFGSGWGGYSASEGKYGAFIFEGWSNSIQFPSNATTSSRGTANIVITEDYAEIKIGKVYGTRDYTTTKTFNSTEKAKIQQIMTSSDVGVSLSNTNYTVVNKANYIVNYEKI